MCGWQAEAALKQCQRLSASRVYRASVDSINDSFLDILVVHGPDIETLFFNCRYLFL